MIFTRSLLPEILKCGLFYLPGVTGYLLPGDRMKTMRPAGRNWWQKPGLGLMYQVEYRPSPCSYSPTTWATSCAASPSPTRCRTGR